MRILFIYGLSLRFKHTFPKKFSNNYYNLILSRHKRFLKMFFDKSLAFAIEMCMRKTCEASPEKKKYQVKRKKTDKVFTLPVYRQAANRSIIIFLFYNAAIL